MHICSAFDMALLYHILPFENQSTRLLPVVALEEESFLVSGPNCQLFYEKRFSVVIVLIYILFTCTLSSGIYKHLLTRLCRGEWAAITFIFATLISREVCDAQIPGRSFPYLV